MQEWTERVLEGVRILFQMGQNRAFHMSYIGGGGEMLLKVLYRGMIAGGVVLAVLLLRMMLCRAPKIYRETLIKAFPAPDLRREAAHSFANPCASAGGSKEVLI